MWESLVSWFFSLGEEYGVNPIVFGSIYVGATPFFSLSIAWLVRNVKKRRPIILPILSTGFFFLSAYLYLIIAGQNIPFWVYLLIAAFITLGVFSTAGKIRAYAGDSD